MDETLINKVAAALFEQNTYGYMPYEWQLEHKPAHVAQYQEYARQLIPLTRMTGSRQERLDRVAKWDYETFNTRARHTSWETWIREADILKEGASKPVHYSTLAALTITQREQTRAFTLINTVAKLDPQTEPIPPEKRH